MVLSELKQPYENLIKLHNIKLDQCKATDIVTSYLNEMDSEKRDLYIAILICKAWPSLQFIFYKGNVTHLSAEECYDIFLQAVYYVIKQQVWLKEDSTLYKDDKAFEKAVAITIQCRKKNYLHAQHRQKRIADYNSLSLEGISEDCSEGYFTPYEQKYSFEESKLNDIISDYFKKKDYITAFILESILNNNVYSVTNELDIRKLRKCLKHLDKKFCKLFAAKYELNLAEVEHSLTYFIDVPQNKLDFYIENTFTKLKNNAIIKQIVY